MTKQTKPRIPTSKGDHKCDRETGDTALPTKRERPQPSGTIAGFDIDRWMKIGFRFRREDLYRGCYAWVNSVKNSFKP